MLMAHHLKPHIWNKCISNWVDWAFVLHTTLFLCQPSCCFHGNSEEQHYTALSRPKFPSVPWGVLLQIKEKEKERTDPEDLKIRYCIFVYDTYKIHRIQACTWSCANLPCTRLTPHSSTAWISLTIRPSAHLTNGAHLPRAPEAQGPKPCAPLGIRNPVTGILNSPTSFLHARKGTFPEAMESFLGRRMSLQAIVDAADSRSPPSTKSAFHRGRILYMLLCECVCVYVSLCLSLSLAADCGSSATPGLCGAPRFSFLH